MTSQLLVPTVEKGYLRVAFATSDGVTVNDHFGWGKQFLLFDVSKHGAKKAGKIAFAGDDLDERGNDGRLAGKIEGLRGCHIVYSAAVGGPAAARLTNERIQPMIASEEKTVEKLLDQLVEALNRPVLPPWLRKITREEDPSRFEKFDSEGE